MSRNGVGRQLDHSPITHSIQIVVHLCSVLGSRIIAVNKQILSLTFGGHSAVEDLGKYLSDK